MAPPRDTPRRAALAAKLRELRRERFPSGVGFARHIGWRQARVSKLEVGEQRPIDDDLVAWVHALDQSDRVLTELREMAAAANAEYVDSQEMYRARRGGAGQDDLARGEHAATRIAHYQPHLVPGLLQTPQYTREMLTAPGSAVLVGADAEQVEQIVAGRARRQEVLYQPGKTLDVVLGEAALRTWFASRETLLGQLDRLMSAAGLSTVELGVLPLGRGHPTMPLSGFSVRDSALVVLETLTSMTQVADPVEVATYVKAHAVIKDMADVGDDAVDLIRAVAEEVRDR